jgi:hypothetical protein
MSAFARSTSSRPSRHTPTRRGADPRDDRVIVRDTASPNASDPSYSGEPGLIVFVEVVRRSDGPLQVVRRRAWIDGSRPAELTSWVGRSADHIMRTLAPGSQARRVAQKLRAAGVA